MPSIGKEPSYQNFNPNKQAFFASDQMSKHRPIGIKEEVDALLNIDSFKLINEPPRGFPLITT